MCLNYRLQMHDILHDILHMCIRWHDICNILRAKCIENVGTCTCSCPRISGPVMDSHASQSHQPLRTSSFSARSWRSRGYPLQRQTVDRKVRRRQLRPSLLLQQLKLPTRAVGKGKPFAACLQLGLQAARLRLLSNSSCRYEVPADFQESEAALRLQTDPIDTNTELWLLQLPHEVSLQCCVPAALTPWPAGMAEPFQNMLTSCLTAAGSHRKSLLAAVDHNR